MRYERQMLLWALASALSLATGCNGLDNDDPGDDDDVPGDDDDDTDTDTDTDDTGPFLEIVYEGEGVLSNGTYTGEESFVATLGPSTPTPELLCRWTWQANGVSPATTALPCTDDQGNPCEFTLEVDLTGGLQTDGDCSVLNTELPTELPTANYGFVEDYAGQGPAIMYYLAADPNDPVNFPAEWYFFGIASFDEQTGEFSYLATPVVYDYP